MSNITNSYSSYLGARRCCDLRGAGPMGPIGIQGVPGPRGIQGFTGFTGFTGPTGRSCMGPTGPGKNFIIDHPLDSSKYLIHACLEGPEVGVYYRGKATIENGESVIIQLPDYVEKIASNFTIQITSIYSKNRSSANIYETSEVENNKFQVYGKNGSFYWYVYGMMHEIVVEPEKTAITVSGDGPYKWYQNNE